MSTSPPPPPPPNPKPPPPFAVPEVQWSRRQAREQRRMAQLAAQQQRHLLRAQLRAYRRSSLLGPVLLVVLGLLLLFAETGVFAWASLLAWLSTWWPLVLVGAGVLLLCEWFYDTQVANRQGTPLQRRTLGTSGVLVLVLLAIAGPSASAVLHSPDWIRARWGLPDTWGLDQFFAQHSETVREVHAPLSPGALLTIKNYRGNVTVTGSSTDGQVHVSATQRFWAWQTHDLQAQQERDKPSLESDGTGVVLSVAGQGRDTTDLTIEVPHQTSLRVAAEHGDVAVSEMRGNLTVEDHTGNVVLTALNGDVHLAVRDDNADITGHSLTGNVTVEGRTGDLAFSDVTGPITLRGDFFGTTHLEHVQGPFLFKSSFTELACAGIPGELNVEGRSELQARNLVGPVTLTTSDRDITLSEIHKGATVKNRKGSVTLSFADLLSPVSVTTTDGNVEVHLPEKASFHVTAETADGEIKNDFGLPTQQQDDRVTLAGQVLKGGPTVQLQTTEGDVLLRSGAVKDAEDDDSQSATDEKNSGHS